MYASPTGDCRMTLKDTSGHECSLMNRLKRSGFIHSNSHEQKLYASNEADASLFKEVLLNENHSLKCLFPNRNFPQPTFYPTNITHVVSGTGLITSIFLIKTRQFFYLIIFVIL